MMDCPVVPAIYRLNEKYLLLGQVQKVNFCSLLVSNNLLPVIVPHANNGLLNKIVSLYAPSIICKTYQSRLSILINKSHTSFSSFQTLLKKLVNIIQIFLLYSGVHRITDHQFINLERKMQQIFIHKMNYILKKPRTQQMSLQKISELKIISNIITKVKITQIQFQQNKEHGGYFEVQKVTCMMINKETKQMEGKKKLAMKCLKQQRRDREANLYKLQRQMQVISAVKNNKYLVRYYLDQEKEHTIFMDCCDFSLKKFLQDRYDELSYYQLTLIALQIVESISLLHESGIVHRDIKPANFLVNILQKYPYYEIKVIDFAQSFSPLYKPERMSALDVGCTHPYSPIECSQSTTKSGLSNKETDYWSVGVVLYELFFNRCPLDYSRVMMADIASGWGDQLLVPIDQRKKGFSRFVESCIGVLCGGLILSDQSQRINLQSVQQILFMAKQFLEQLENKTSKYIQKEMQEYSIK